jgi:hypothetical protein
VDRDIAQSLDILQPMRGAKGVASDPDLWLDRLVPPAKDRTDGVVSGLFLAVERDGVLEVDDDGVGA